jgi:hypothetical protein
MNSYSRVLKSAFKRFSIQSALRTALPTLWFYSSPQALAPSEKPALFSMNIFPPMIAVWYHLVRKNLGNAVDVTIFDCSGTLRPRDFPGARIQKFLNPRHAMKCDAFVYRIAKHRKIAWVCDDDVFILSPRAVTYVQQQMRDPNTASVSFEPRKWWELQINGKRYQPSGTYCIALNKNIFADREHLSFAPADHNTHPTITGKIRRYDSFDKANEILLQKGYTCAIAPEDVRRECVAYFSGLSGAVMLLNYFRTPTQMLDYLLAPDKQFRTGDTLYGVLAGLLALSTVVELHQKLELPPYPVPAFPSRAELERVRREYEKHLEGGRSFAWVDAASEQLRSAL